jgi:hypothetical protein
MPPFVCRDVRTPCYVLLLIVVGVVLDHPNAQILTLVRPAKPLETPLNQ